jgi:hypothetical protein
MAAGLAADRYRGPRAQLLLSLYQTPCDYHAPLAGPPPPFVAGRVRLEPCAE